MNHKYTSLIIDDLEENVSILKELLNNFCPTIKVIGEANTIKEAIELIDRNKPEIIYLDVELNEGTCFDILKEISYKDAKIILTTSHDKYAINAFDYNISGYILKPIQLEKLIKTTYKVCEEIDKLNALSKKHQNTDAYLTVSSMKRIDIVKVSDVNYIQSKGQYSVFLLDDSEVIAAKNVGFYETKIDSSKFCRVHHSYLINTDKIVHINKNDNLYCVMKNGHEVPISNRKYKDLLSVLNYK